MDEVDVRIFDTTMRDGEQSPGAAMSRDDKVRIGKQLEKLKVDVIEAGRRKRKRSGAHKEVTGRGRADHRL